MGAERDFPELSEEEYSGMRTIEIFDIYLSMLHRRKLHPADADERDKIQALLLKQPLPEKVYFYQSLDGWKKRIYKAFLTVDGKKKG